MTVKKAKLNSKSLGLMNTNSTKPSTITRAAITADIKLTRGKQLVEHNPLALIPDPNNPRPGDQIDDHWLNRYLFINTPNSLCHYDKDDHYIIPSFNQLGEGIAPELEEHYEFLRSLAYSLRNDGVIEPIEIFLTDINNDPEYFNNTNLDYGYVILEGHQRRLAAILAGLKTVTCIEILDETMLARLKVRHRKIRRQLSENNLRKGLTVGQNYIIVKELLKSDDCINITNKELSSIIGLNEDIAAALKRLALQQTIFPASMLKLIEENQVSFKWIRTWISKSYVEIEEEVRRISTGYSRPSESSINNVKPRGRNGGAVKRTAIFKVNKERDSVLLQSFLLKRIPELKIDYVAESTFYSLENVLNRLLELAKSNEVDPGRN